VLSALALHTNYLPIFIPISFFATPSPLSKHNHCPSNSGLWAPILPSSKHITPPAPQDLIAISTFQTQPNPMDNTTGASVLPAPEIASEQPYNPFVVSETFLSARTYLPTKNTAKLFAPLFVPTYLRCSDAILVPALFFLDNCLSIQPLQESLFITYLFFITPDFQNPRFSSKMALKVAGWSSFLMLVLGLFVLASDVVAGGVVAAGGAGVVELGERAAANVTIGSAAGRLASSSSCK